MLQYIRLRGPRPLGHCCWTDATSPGTRANHLGPSPAWPVTHTHTHLYRYFSTSYSRLSPCTCRPTRPLSHVIDLTRAGRGVMNEHWVGYDEVAVTTLTHLVICLVLRRRSRLSANRALLAVSACVSIRTLA